jgi:hypothetical protein
MRIIEGGAAARLDATMATAAPAAMCASQYPAPDLDSRAMGKPTGVIGPISEERSWQRLQSNSTQHVWRFAPGRIVIARHSPP